MELHSKINPRFFISLVHLQTGGLQEAALTQTLRGAVGVVLVAVVPTVIFPVTGPALRDAAAAIALEVGTDAGAAAADLVAVIPAVIICSSTDAVRLSTVAQTLHHRGCCS